MYHFDAGFLIADVDAPTLGDAKCKLKAKASMLEEAPVYNLDGVSVQILLPDAQIDDDRNWSIGGRR